VKIHVYVLNRKFWPNLAFCHAPSCDVSRSVHAPTRLDKTRLLSAKLDSRLHQIVVASDAVAAVWDLMALSD